MVRKRNKLLYVKNINVMLELHVFFFFFVS